MTAGRDLFGEPAAAIAAPVRFGRRVFLPGAARVQITRMSSDGASLEAIASAVGISAACLRKRFKAELERGRPGGRRPGRPRWAPTAVDRADVERLAGEGVGQDRIAQIFGISAPTLRRHCSAELARGREMANAVRPAGGG